MTSDRKPDRIISFRQIIAYTFLVELYNVTVILLDTFLSRNSPLEGFGFWEIVLMFVNTMIPDIIIIFMAFCTAFYITRTRRLCQKPFLKVCTDVLICTAFAFIVYKLFHLILLISSPELRLNWNEAFTNVTLIMLIVEIIYFAHNYRESGKQAERARREALQYKYNVLKAQVNPHFLFNSLNILSSLIDIDTRKSHEFIEALSKTYRYIVEQQDKELVSLEEEMQCAESYTDILRTRYMNQFRVSITGKENIPGKKLIPMTLQLLIENVTKHNIVSTKYPMQVDIKIGTGQIEISNPIRRRNHDGTGTGLKYLYEQYRLHGQEITITDTGDIFSVTIPYLK